MIVSKDVTSIPLPDMDSDILSQKFFVNTSLSGFSIRFPSAILQT